MSEAIIDFKKALIEIVEDDMKVRSNFEFSCENKNLLDEYLEKNLSGVLYREYILEKGGTADPMFLYKKFRGKEPGIEPLLKRRGLV